VVNAEGNLTEREREGRRPDRDGTERDREGNRAERDREAELRAFYAALAERPFDHDFFFTVRRIEALHPDRPRLGDSVRASDDPVRLGQEPSLAFAPSTLARFTPQGDRSSIPRLWVYFLGVFGPNGPLPLHLTDYARERLRAYRDPSLSRFADIFHHRFLSLFYRAWAATQPAVSFDRPKEDRFSAYVGSLIGLGMDSVRERDALADQVKLHFAGRLSAQNKSAENLEGMIADYYDFPARVVEFVGQWLDLPEDALWKLGDSPSNGSLGSGATLGSRVWDCQSKFRIVLGPLQYDQYLGLLPGSPGMARLIALVRSFIGDELDWDVNLVLRTESVPPFRLGASGQLGWTTWLAGKSRRPVRDEALFTPLHHAA
jgi:type VI secretion system protein ImpH